MSITRANTYDWKRSVVMAAIPVALGIVYYVIDPSFGPFVLLMFLLSFVLLYYVTVWLRTRARMEITDDDVLRVRRWFAWQEVQPGTVRKVVHVFNGRSPDFKLKRASGPSMYVPTSILEAGHSTLFRWLQQQDGIDYDQGSTKTLDTLRQEALL